MKPRRKLHAFTDYPFYEGDKSIKHVRVVMYDGDKYCRVYHPVHGHQEVKSGYLFKDEGLTKYLSKRNLYYITSRNSWDFYDNKNTSVIPKLVAEGMLKEERRRGVTYVVYQGYDYTLQVEARLFNNFSKAKSYALARSLLDKTSQYDIVKDRHCWCGGRKWPVLSGVVFSAINGYSFNHKGAKHG